MECGRYFAAVLFESPDPSATLRIVAPGSFQSAIATSRRIARGALSNILGGALPYENGHYLTAEKFPLRAGPHVGWKLGNSFRSFKKYRHSIHYACAYEKRNA